MASAGTVTLDLDANSVKLLRELQKSQRATQRAAGRMQRSMTRAFRTISRTIVSAGSAMAAFAAFRGFDRLATELDKINKLVDRLGGSAEAFSELKFVAEQSGLAFNTLTMGLQRMQRRVAEAAVGTGEAQGALKELGLSARQLSSLAIDVQFELIADALSQVGSDADRTRLAMKLFDSEGVALLQTMTDGAKGIQQLRREARQLGASMSGEQVQAATDAKDAFNRLGTATTALSNALVIRLAPALTQVADGFANLLTGNRQAEIARRMDWIREKLDAKGRNRATPSQARVWLDEFEMLSRELQELQYGQFDLPPLTEIVVDEDKLREGLKRVEQMYKDLPKAVNAAIEEPIGFIYKRYLPRLPEEAKKSFDQMEEFSKQAARNMQDAFADFLFDPFEDGVRGMIRSFLDAIRRMLANQLAASFFQATGIGAFFNPFGKRADGGPVTAGAPYLVGERGPELFVPNRNGTVISNDRMGGGGVTVNYSIDARGADEAGVVARIVPLLEQTVEATKNAIRLDFAEGRFT